MQSPAFVVAAVLVFTTALGAGAPQPADYWKTRAPRIGDDAPPLTVEKVFDRVAGVPDPASSSWRDYRGKAVVIEFSASWCAPCRAVVPHMNELVTRLQGKPVAFLTISNEDDARIEKFRQQNPNRSVFARDANGSTFEDYWVNGLPYAVVVDPAGKIAALTYPLAITEAVLADVLAGKPAGLPIMNATPIRQDWDARPLAERGPQPGASNAVGATIVELDKAVGRSKRDPKTGVIIAAGPARMLVRLAFGVVDKLIVDERGLPEGKYWEATVRPPDGKLETSQAMLRTLVETTFGFTAARETRTQPVRFLKRLQDAPALAPPAPDRKSSSASAGRYDAASTVVDLANWLTAISPVPVLDASGLTGRFEITFEWDPAGGDDALRGALAKAGFTLEDGTAPVEFVVLKRQ